MTKKIFDFFEFDKDYVKRVKKHLLVHTNLDFNSMRNNFNESVPLAMAKDGKYPLLLELLQSEIVDYDFSIKDNNGWAIIHYICSTDKTELLEYLINNKKDVHLKTNNQDSPFKLAIDGLHYDCIKTLLNETSEEEKNKVLTELLSTPTGRGGWRVKKVEMVANLIIDSIKDINLLSDQNTLVGMCGNPNLFTYGREIILNIAKKLIRKGIDIEYVDKKNKDCLNYAIKNNMEDVVDLLIINGKQIKPEHLKESLTSNGALGNIYGQKNSYNYNIIKNIILKLKDSEFDLSEYEYNQEISKDKVIAEMFEPILAKISKDKISMEINKVDKKNTFTKI